MVTVSEWKFNSIVCLDLETTGLPQYDNKVKITELAVSGVVRDHIKPTNSAEKTVQLPRIVHKLSISMYPNKLISFESSNVSGLYNDILEPIQPWNKQIAEMLITFLNHLPSPVCLIAHNGNKFDFPILKQHLNMFEFTLPDHILCVDSLPAFQKILLEYQAHGSTIIEEMQEEMNSNNDEFVRILEEYEKQQHSVDQNPCMIPYNLKNAEVTPVLHSKVPPNYKLRTFKKEIQNNQYLPNNSQVRRCLFPTKPRVSYKLSEVHKLLFGAYPEQSHNAEEDALTLLKCVLKTSPQFLQWANDNCQPFNSI